MLLETRPAMVSFHFGLPDEDQIRALREAGIILFGSATSLAEAQALADAGLDAIVAQGYEAGGHRGAFDENAPDDRLGTFTLIHLLSRRIDLPVIAAGGIMDGVGISAALKLGAARRSWARPLSAARNLRPMPAIARRWPARRPTTP